MKSMRAIRSLFLVLLLALPATIGKAAPLGTEFLYQGFLSVNGSPANGTYEMIFTLFRQGETTPGPSVSNNNVMVSLGVFSVSLDFGAGVFDGTAYELGIAVRERGSGQFVTLQPRQLLTATPNATHARTVGSVPDSALSPNVALLDGSPMFTTPLKATMLRVANPGGGGVLNFGNNPDNICAISVDPQGPAGLLLRDPRGIRILSPDPASPPRLLFGPTDDCSIGIDPAFPGLVERDPIGFRLLGQNNQGCRLIFGPTMDCTVEVDPAGPMGLLLRDPRGIRILPPPAGPGVTPQPRLLFGPTDDCSIGIDPVITGLVLRDPRGIRIAPADPMAPSRLIFGPTDDCSIGIDPATTGLVLRDPRGIRIAPADPMALPRLIFGPTDDCSIGIDPAFPGLVERDPIGFRLLGRNNQGCRLIFGPTMDCTVEVDPAGPQGLLLRDPRGIRILPPDPADLPVLRFGPTDDCSIGIDPAFPGLVERDPIGFRLLGRNNQGCRLIFGPTMDCTIEVRPPGGAGAVPGLLLRDPSGIRVLSPDPQRPPNLLFGPTDDCSIGIDPVLSGLRLRDPGGIRIAPTDPMALPTLRFGPTDDCSIGIDPALAGLLLRDPSGVRIAPANPMALPRLLFGPTDDCSIGIDPAFPGLVERDPIGFRLLGRNDQGCRLIFGPTMDCTVEVDPTGPGGLLLRDPKGIRILPPAGPGMTAQPRLLFGPTDDCSIGIDPTFPGLVERDPTGFRLLGRSNEGGRLIFGPTMNCTIEVRPSGSNFIAGLLLRDPSGVRILNPVPAGQNTLRFGPTDDCSISAPDANGGMRFSDPRGFTFQSQVAVNGPVFAQAFIQTSSRRFKNDVKPIEEPLEKISKLQGVRFTWNEEKGGRPDVGFIAEEVAKVIPELVSMEEDGQNARGVNYDHLVAVAIEGIKAQQTQIQTLEREKAELKETLTAMQARLDRLGQQVETLMAR